MASSNPLGTLNQLNICYKGQTLTQGLNVNKGPQMHVVKSTVRQTLPTTQTISPTKSAIVYPTTHSIPNPYLQSYIFLPTKKVYMY